MKYFLTILRWSLRLHGIIHFVELGSALYEKAYITASLACFIGITELLASFFIPNEHIHFKPFKSEVHSKCDNEHD